MSFNFGTQIPRGRSIIYSVPSRLSFLNVIDTINRVHTHDNRFKSGGFLYPMERIYWWGGGGGKVGFFFPLRRGQRRNIILPIGSFRGPGRNAGKIH